MSEDEEPATRPTLPPHALRSGQHIREYRIDSLLGEGGFGIVYLATELVLERRVAIKEYLPTSIATRNPGTLPVHVKSPIDEETFALGLKSFVNEARLLARFDHPALVKVHRFWEENGTAYMVMPYYEGRTLQSALEKLGRRPTEAELRQWLEPLLDALHVLHAAQCYHRDIAPDNILITDGGPLLLDFGAARRVIGDQQKTLTVVLKPGFAPIEQYGESSGLHQGAWTDVYALGGVLYAAITGARPLPAVSRLMDDRQPRVSDTAAGRYSAPFLHAIDTALSLRPQHRPQSVAEFRVLMDTPVAVAGDAPDIDLNLTMDGEFDVPADSARHAPPPPAPVRAERAVSRGQPAPAPTPTPTATAAGPASASSSRRGVVVGGAVGVGLLAFAAWFLTRPAAAPEVAEVPPPVPAPVPAPVATPAPTPEVVTMPASAPTQAPPPPAPAPEPAPAPALSPAPAPAPAPAPEAAPAPAIAKPRPERAEPRVARPAAEPPPSIDPAKRTKCGDILAKGSLEPLTAAETAYLRRECR